MPYKVGSSTLHLPGLGVEESVVIEIERMLAFLSGWFRGEYEPAVLRQGFEDALHPDFEHVPTGGVSIDRTEMIDQIRDTNGDSPFFRIECDDVKIIAIYPEFVVATYVEHQSGARNSAQVNHRRVTVMLEIGPRLRWLHVHETTIADNPEIPIACL